MNTLLALGNSVSIFSDTLKYLQLSKNPSLHIEELKILWAKDILKRLKVNLTVVGDISRDPSVLFLGNHISYLDIPLLMSAAPNISFVAKHELAQWPVLGQGAKKINTVFVKRNNKDSRSATKESIHQALLNQQRVVIFPSGTTCMKESKPWKWGAFQIAKERNCFVQPFRVSYSPLREAAYIDDDFFPTHLFNLCKRGPIKAKLEFHPPVKIENAEVDSQMWQQWATRHSEF